MERFDWAAFVEYYRVSALGAAIILLARVGHVLGKQPVPPTDVKAFEAWRLRRRWFLIMEASSFPALSGLGAMATMASGGSPYVAMFSGMIAGGVGFPFAMSAMRDFVRRRVGDGGFDQIDGEGGQNG